MPITKFEFAIAPIFALRLRVRRKKTENLYVHVESVTIFIKYLPPNLRPF